MLQRQSTHFWKPLKRNYGRRTSAIREAIGRRIIKTIKFNCGISSIRLKADASFKAIDETVRRHQHKKSLKMYKRKQRHRLLKMHKERTLVFTEDYQNWKHEWKSVLFSEEKNPTSMACMDIYYWSDLKWKTEWPCLCT